MAYKISFILTLTFVVQLLILCGDLFALQLMMSHLDAIGQTVSFKIANTGFISQELTDWLQDEEITFVCLRNCQPRFGDILKFSLTCQYDPLIIASEPVDARIVRDAVIGYYN